MAALILGINHLVLRVADTERVLRFYCDALGYTEESRVERTLGLVRLRAGRSMIDLINATGVGDDGDEVGRNMYHFALRIETFDEATLCAHLKAHGVEVGGTVKRYRSLGISRSMLKRGEEALPALSL